VAKGILLPTQDLLTEWSISHIV